MIILVLRFVVLKEKSQNESRAQGHDGGNERLRTDDVSELADAEERLCEENGAFEHLKDEKLASQARIHYFLIHLLFNFLF